jgi:hypothetical protein
LAKEASSFRGKRELFLSPTAYAASKVRPIPQGLGKLQAKSKEKVTGRYPKIQGPKKRKEEEIGLRLGLKLREEVPGQNEPGKGYLQLPQILPQAGKSLNEARFFEEGKAPAAVVDEAHPVRQIQIRPAS